MRKWEHAGEWSQSQGTAVGCNNFGNYTQNPQFLVRCSGRNQFIARLVLGNRSREATNVTLYRCGLPLRTSSPASSLNLSHIPTGLTVSLFFYSESAAKVCHRTCIPRTTQRWPRRTGQSTRMLQPALPLARSFLNLEITSSSCRPFPRGLGLSSSPSSPTRVCLWLSADNG